MPNTSTNKKLALLLMLSLGLTSITGILGAPPLRAIHIAYGRFKYWFIMFLASALMWGSGLIPVALCFAVLVVAIGVYRELEREQKGWLVCGMLSLIAALITAGLGAWLWSYQEGWMLGEQLREVVQSFLQKAGLISGAGSEEFDLDTVVAQVPSVVAIFVVISLALSLIYEKRLMGWFELEGTGSIQHLKLTSFRMPDGFVWLSMVAFLVTTVNFGFESLTVVGANILNVMIVLYFFQGLAVFESLFQHFGVAPLWRLLMYLILIAQLFFLLSFVGFIDFWIGFRERLIKKEAEAPTKQE